MLIVKEDEEESQNIKKTKNMNGDEEY